MHSYDFHESKRKHAIFAKFRIGGLPARSEPVGPEIADPEIPVGKRDLEVPGGAHETMRDDVDGDEAMVPRVLS